jgi:hypothetical protein
MKKITGIEITKERNKKKCKRFKGTEIGDDYMI